MIKVYEGDCIGDQVAGQDGWYITDDYFEEAIKLDVEE